MESQRAVTERVEHELTARHMTRSELGRLLGRDRCWVTRKLNGDRLWALEDIDLLARGLGLEPWELLEADAGAVCSSRCAPA